jgi:hypothetical protein
MLESELTTPEPGELTGNGLLKAFSAINSIEAAQTIVVKQNDFSIVILASKKQSQIKIRPLAKVSSVFAR